ncbi:retrotransposon protein [Tanacetum coccineum]|uniref:Retrotransposon protein n=1 Tax=Tanacetum coccineum TaxID=301880 RepID=A0ABQ4X7S4_9ASTR
MTKTAKVKGSALDAEIQIILLENVQSHRETRTKEHSLEVLGVIAVKRMTEKSLQKRTCLVAIATRNELICLGVDLEPNEWIKDSGCSKHMMGNRKLFSTYKAYNGGNVIFCSNLRGNIIGKGRGIRKKGLYVMKLGNKPKDKICLATIDENSILWHRRLGHANMRLIQSLASKELVRNLPKLREFCNANGITHNFSAPRTPQSNGVVERKNRTLQEMSRTMLKEQSLP